MDTLPLLNSFRAYTDFTDEDFAVFIKYCIPIKLKKNEFFYKAGEVPKYSPFILKGCTRQFTMNENGDEQIILFVEEGTWAGQIGSMRSKIPTNVYLQATENCDILGITIENADFLMDKLPTYQRYFTKKYPVDHAHMMNNALRIKTDTPENLYNWLLETQPSLLQRVPQHYIANYLGIRTETISRIRKKIAGK
jgi:CRP-like cAMP-binding protein